QGPAAGPPAPVPGPSQLAGQPALAAGSGVVLPADEPALCRGDGLMSYAPYALGVFILLAYTLEALTRFGSIVIALSLGALLLPIDQLLPVLVPLNIGMTGYLVSRHWRLIDRRLLLGTILPGMLAGTLLGYWLLPHLDTQALKAGFGALILW